MGIEMSPASYSCHRWPSKTATQSRCFEFALDATQDTCQIPAMTPTEVARRYHDAWNGRDADALVATFTKGGTLCNPDTYPGVSGEAIAAYVKGLWAAFPIFISRCLMLVKSSRAWSPIIGW